MKGAWKILLVLVLLGGAAFLLRPGHRGNDGEDNAKVWFYDQSTRTLYPAPRNAIPPDTTRGTTNAPGVRAVVVAFHGEENNPKKRKIAYLETYGPELKNLLDRVQAAQRAKTPFEGKIPDRDGSFVRENTLVRRIDEPQWSASSTEEGRKIMIEWQEWVGPDGKPPVVCLP